MVARGKLSDSWTPRTYATDDVKDAFHTLFNIKIDDMTRRLDRYITSGALGKCIVMIVTKLIYCLNQELQNLLVR